MNAAGTGHATGQFSVYGRLLMLLLNFWTLVFSIVLVVMVTALDKPLPYRVLLAAGFLYLFPPLVARIICMLFPIDAGRYPYGSRQFMVWWALFSLQSLFLRLPMLEELLRIVPGLYSVWLRLWGAKVGRLTYWAPGTVVLDRPFLRLGDDVVFGAGVRINPHVIDQVDGGQRELILASVEIDDRVVVGGYSLLTAGTRLREDQTLRAFTLSPPFSEWRDGKRVRGGAGVQ